MVVVFIWQFSGFIIELVIHFYFHNKIAFALSKNNQIAILDIVAEVVTAAPARTISSAHTVAHRTLDKEELT